MLAFINQYCKIYIAHIIQGVSKSLNQFEMRIL